MVDDYVNGRKDCNGTVINLIEFSFPWPNKPHFGGYLDYIEWSFKLLSLSDYGIFLIEQVSISLDLFSLIDSLLAHGLIDHHGFVYDKVVGRMCNLNKSNNEKGSLSEL